MPPQVTQYSHPLVTPRTPLLARISPKTRLNRILHQKYFQGLVGRRMKFTKKKIIPILIFILCSASVFRFLNVTRVANFSVSLPSLALPSTYQIKNTSSFTEKETRFVMELFSKRVPCNLLVFGSAFQYSSLASVNGGGFTVFLEDYQGNTSTAKPTNNTQVHKIKYNTVASQAYQLLRDARANHECRPKFYRASKCNLALANLPQEVYDTMWDVVIVDGPGGGSPDSPGRMTSIYTASMLARRGNSTHVVVHDVDRMIEKWFSWEFLCEENLVSSKGRFWHFKLARVINATKFCTT